jgi:hypothetical protein
MSAQETTATPKKRAGTKEKAEEQARQVKAGEQQQQQDAFKDPSLDEQIETLVPQSEAKIWIIGKPPEMGGEDNEWERYIQRKLGFIEMQRFFALCSKAMLRAIKEGGDNAVSELGGMFGGGDIRTMTAQLRQQDFNEAANFMAMAFALVSYVPEFLTDCYALWLRVPDTQQLWFRRTIEQPWDPDNEMYGLSNDAGREMIERFLDQNYEDIRDFFAREIPNLFDRVKQLEKKRTDRESGSQQSKQSNT